MKKPKPPKRQRWPELWLSISGNLAIMLPNGLGILHRPRYSEWITWRIREWMAFDRASEWTFLGELKDD